MPIYEFYCPDNNKIYQFFAKTLAQAQTVPVCPDNPSFRMEKIVSGFSIGGATKKSKASESDSQEGPESMPQQPDPPGMESALAEMESQLEGLDENDPKAMARVMRRMSEVTGEPIDGPMEEMVRKLEEGMDPERLEEQMGDVLGEEAESDEDGGFGGGGRGAAPQRDPQLYDY